MKFRNIFFYIILFGIFVLFYGKVHPIVPFSTDDWINMNIDRSFYPSLNYWNPTKVFPECLEPLVAIIASYFIQPIIGDFLVAQIIANSCIVSLFIVIYFYNAQKLLESKFVISKYCSNVLTILFIMFHFLILIINRNENDFLWHSDDANCYYHYTIPNLLCSSFVLWLIHNDIKKNNIIKILFVSYLCLFSNLYASVILISFIGSNLLINLINTSKKKKWLKIYISDNSIYIIFILLWLIIQLLEVNGIRANSYGHLNQPFAQDLMTTFNLFLSIHFNSSFIYLLIFIIIGAFCIHCKKNYCSIFTLGDQQIAIIFSAILSCIYIVFLSSRVKPENILKGDINFELFFYVLLFCFLCSGYICQHYPQIKVIIPLIVVFVFFQIQTKDNTFRDILHDYGYSANELINMDRSIIEQIRQADAVGDYNPIIHIPTFIRPGKYPLSNDCSESIGISLYKYNLTKHQILPKFDTDNCNCPKMTSCQK